MRFLFQKFDSKPNLNLICKKNLRLTWIFDPNNEFVLILKFERKQKRSKKSDISKMTKVL